jgi:hypothetical protein
MGFFSRIFQTGIQGVFKDIDQRQAHHPGIHLNLPWVAVKIAIKLDTGGFDF